MGNNAEESLMSDVNLRKAVYYGIDNEAIATVAGTVLPAKALGTPFFPDYNTDWETADNNYMAVYDPEKAQDTFPSPTITEKL